MKKHIKNDYDKLIYILTWRCISRQDELHRKLTRDDISDWVIYQFKNDKEIVKMYIDCCIENKYNNIALLISNVRTKLWEEYNSEN
jgi:hypothetical protein